MNVISDYVPAEESFVNEITKAISLVLRKIDLKSAFYGSTLHCYNSVSSTMDLAYRLELANRIILSREQTMGRGRGDRPWFSGKDKGIYVTYVVRPVDKVKNLNGFSLAIGIAIRRALSQSGLDVKLKWPNDVVVDSYKSESLKKIAGVLVDVRTEGNELRGIYIGVGLNLFPQNYPQGVQGISVAELSSSQIKYCDIFAILTSNVIEVSELYFTHGFEYFVSEYDSASAIVGRKINLKNHGKLIVGNVQGVEKDGGLRIQLPGDVTENVVVYSGEVVIPYDTCD